MKRVKRKMSEETKLKISQGNKGKIVSEETKKKLRFAMMGKVPSEKTKLKIKQGLIKYWSNVIWVTDNEIKEVKAKENE